MDASTDISTDTSIDVTAEQTRREAATLRHWQAVNQILDQRDDLVGVHPLADLIHDAVRWSA